MYGNLLASCSYDRKVCLYFTELVSDFTTGYSFYDIYFDMNGNFSRRFDIDIVTTDPSKNES